MFCKHCGKELTDDAAFCPHCGTATREAPAAERDEFFEAAPARPAAPAYSTAEPKKTWNPLAIVGFVLAFVVSIAGLICSCIALKQCRERKEDGKGMALAGIIISAVSLGISTLYFIIFLGSGLLSEIIDALLAVI